MDGAKLSRDSCPPESSKDALVVDGLQGLEAPTQVSRTKTSRAPLVSPGTRLVASDAKAMNRPFALMAGEKLEPLASEPSLATETRFTEGVQLVGMPRQVSRRNMSLVPFESPDTRLLAYDENAMKRPSAPMAAASLYAFASVKSDATLDRSITPTAPAGTDFTSKLIELEFPPPGEGLKTLTWAAPPFARSDAGMLVFNNELLKTDVERLRPFH